MIFARIASDAWLARGGLAREGLARKGTAGFIAPIRDVAPLGERRLAEILRTEVKDDSWATFLRAEVRLDDGQVVWRQIEHHGEAAVVLPYDPDRRTALLVRLFRPPPLYVGGSGMMVEAVAGMIDEGESAESAARREALEEAGVRLSTLERVAQVWTTPGISTERMTLFLAPYSAQDRITSGGGVAGEHENIEVLEPTLAELGRDLTEGRLADMKLLALVQALRLRRPDLFDATGA